MPNIEISALNFDSQQDDGVINSSSEINALLISGMFRNPITNPNLINTYLANDLTADTFGGALIETSQLVLDVNKSHYPAWFHEIGHAFGGLNHPSGINNNVKVSEFLADDKKNFMYRDQTTRINNIRRYQFQPMRK